MDKDKLPERENPTTGWSQPLTEEIAIDATHAVMTKKTFDQLKDYSYSVPTGVWVGKLWKRQGDDTTWWLCWFNLSEKPGICRCRSREILIA